MTAIACRMTDEELDALTGDVPTPVGSPYLDGLDPTSRELARQTAQRSLMVRRLLEPTGDLRSDLVHRAERGGTAPGRPTGLVRVVLDLRAGAPVVLVLHRWTGAARDGSEGASQQSRYLHVVADTVVSEDVTPAGVHTFGLDRYAAVPQLIEEFLVPPDARRQEPAKGPGQVFTDPGEATRLLGLLRGPTVLAESVVLQAVAPGEPAAPPDPRTLALGPHGCFAGTPTRAGTRYRELDARAIVTDLVADVDAAREAVATALTRTGAADPEGSTADGCGRVTMAG